MYIAFEFMYLFLSAFIFCSQSTSLKLYLCNSGNTWIAVFRCSLVRVVRVDDGSSLSEVFSRSLLNSWSEMAI